MFYVVLLDMVGYQNKIISNPVVTTATILIKNDVEDNNNTVICDRYYGYHTRTRMYQAHIQGEIWGFKLLIFLNLIIKIHTQIFKLHVFIILFQFIC